MQGLSPLRVPQLIDKDVWSVLHGAAVVIEIGHSLSDFNMDFRFERTKPNLWVIAIVGPGEFQGTKFEKALLCEIGIFRGRPYAAAYDKETGDHFAKRRKWFSLSEGQYQFIAPIVFEVMQYLTDQKSDSWHPVFFPSTRRIVGKEKTCERITWRNFKKGVRYSVSEQDVFLFSDIFAAETNNNQVKQHIQGFIRFLDKLLDGYRNGTRVNFWSLKRANEAWEAIRGCSLPDYLKISALRDYCSQIPDRYKQGLPYFYPYLCEAVCGELVAPPKETQEERYAKSALPSIEERINQAQIRVVRRNNGYVIFEMYNSSSTE